jgi:hypothetical protein
MPFLDEPRKPFSRSIDGAGELRSGIRETLDTDSVVWMDCSCGGHSAKLLIHIHDNRGRTGHLP